MDNSKKILIIDDDEINNYIVKRLIGNLDIYDEIITFKNGQEALSFSKGLLNNNHPFPCCILLDIHMPVMSGFEFLRALKELHYDFSNLNIIAVSTSSNPKDLELLKSFGIYHIISKPLTKEKLLNALKLSPLGNDRMSE